MKKIVFTGGGTAGHVTPNVALINELCSDFELHYIGSYGGMEKNILRDLPITFHEVKCVKLIRSFSLKNLAIPFVLCRSVNRCKQLLKTIAPSVIFSKGGFVGLPVALASNDIPLIIHESDSSLGLANRLALSKATLLCTAFDTLTHKKAIYTGAPIRQQIYEASKARAISELKIEPSTKPVLLITGGSLGARALNDFVFSNLDALCERFTVIHLFGKNEQRRSNRKGYYGLGFSDRIYDLFAAADFVVSRGGANTLFELVALSKPTVCVPLQKGSRGDQVENAEYFASKGVIELVRENELCVHTLFRAINRLAKNEDRIVEAAKKIKVDGTKRIANLIRKYAN